MATHTPSPSQPTSKAQPQPDGPRLALRPSFGSAQPDGAWWPSSRVLADALGELFAQWPAERGHIRRLVYSPPDWDDRPRVVAVPGRAVKTGWFPRDDTRLIILTMASGDRRAIEVIAPGTEPDAARATLAAVADGTAHGS